MHQLQSGTTDGADSFTREQDAPGGQWMSRSGSHRVVTTPTARFGSFRRQPPHRRLATRRVARKALGIRSYSRSWCQRRDQLRVSDVDHPGPLP